MQNPAVSTSMQIVEQVSLHIRVPSYALHHSGEDRRLPPGVEQRCVSQRHQEGEAASAGQTAGSESDPRWEGFA